jgi:hypothetical protein
MELRYHSVGPKTRSVLKRPPNEGSATNHCLKWSPFPPDDVGRIAQDVRDGEGRRKQKD